MVSGAAVSAGASVSGAVVSGGACVSGTVVSGGAVVSGATVSVGASVSGAEEDSGAVVSPAVVTASSDAFGGLDCLCGLCAAVSVGAEPADDNEQQDNHCHRHENL